MQYTKNLTNAPQGQNPNTAIPGCGVPMNLPHRKLQFYLHRRIKQVFEKQS